MKLSDFLVTVRDDAHTLTYEPTKNWIANSMLVDFLASCNMLSDSVVISMSADDAINDQLRAVINGAELILCAPDQDLDALAEEHGFDHIDFIWADDYTFIRNYSILEYTAYIQCVNSTCDKLAEQITNLPGTWRTFGHHLLDNIGYRDSLITDTGIWTVPNMNEHAFDQGLAMSMSMFIEKHKVKSIYDFGCGPGEYVKYFRSLGLVVDGYDGNPNTLLLSDGQCHIQDLTADFSLPTRDMVLCLEVGEHIPAEFEDLLLDNITKHASKYVILSWAIPGQGGYGHVNCQANEHVIEQMSRRGFRVLPEDAEFVRSMATLDWFRNDTIMVFEK